MKITEFNKWYIMIEDGIFYPCFIMGIHKKWKECYHAKPYNGGRWDLVNFNDKIINYTKLHSLFYFDNL